MSTSKEGHYWLQVDQLVAMVVDARNTCGPMKRHVLHVSNASMIELPGWAAMWASVSPSTARSASSIKCSVMRDKIESEPGSAYLLGNRQHLASSSW